MLVSLSVGAAVTVSLETNVMQRLAWLETVFQVIDPRVSQTISAYCLQSLMVYQDPDIREVAPKIIEVLSERLQTEYMRINEDQPHNPALRKIHALAKHARDLRNYIR